MAVSVVGAIPEVRVSNPIRKQRGRLVTMVNTTTKVRVHEKWYAICPDCGEGIDGTPSRYTTHPRGSRKTAKDALHRHLVQAHSKPSLARIQV